MGYFSELDLTHQEETERYEPSKVQQLTERIYYLNERLIDLEGECPRDMMNPAFDRLFYSECLTGSQDDVNTIQGVLRAIHKAEDMLHLAEEEEQRELEEQQRRAEWRNVVWETGETPDHQLVLLDAFFPADHSAAA